MERKNQRNCEPQSRGAIYQCPLSTARKRAPRRCPTLYDCIEDAQQWARENNIQSVREYREKVPDNFPRFPDTTYARTGLWTNWYDFLALPHPEKTFASYEDAQAWAISNNITSGRAWKSADRPSNMPYNPQEFYKDTGKWKGWGGFLGTGRVRRTEFVTFEEARNWARQNNILTAQQWLAAIKPDNIPALPWRVYEAEWISFPHFLGTENAPAWYATYEEAKEYRRSENILSYTDWQRRYREGLLRGDMPCSLSGAYPEYRETGWAGFVGLKQGPLSSAMERFIATEIGQFLDVDDKPVRISLRGGKTKRPDMLIRNGKTIIEFDGCRYHGTGPMLARDKEEISLLNELGWTVIRIREAPLQALSELDIEVPTQKWRLFDIRLLPRIEIILRHLMVVGIIDPARHPEVENYLKQVRASGQFYSQSKASEILSPARYESYEEASNYAKANRIPYQATHTHAPLFAFRQRRSPAIYLVQQ